METTLEQFNWWKWSLLTMAIASAGLLISEFYHAYHPLITEKTHGSLGVKLVDQEGWWWAGQSTNKLTIEELELAVLKPDSPLLLNGARKGDAIRFDRPLDRWRKFNVREKDPEKVSLTLFEGEEEIPVTVEAQAVPITNAQRFDYVSRGVLAVFALVFGFLIGIRGAKDLSNRWLALTFIALSLNFYYNFNYSPHGPVFTISRLANLMTYGLTWFFGAAFTLSYRNEARAKDLTFIPKRDKLVRLFSWYRVLTVIIVIYSLFFGLGFETPGQWFFAFAGALVCIWIQVFSLIDGRRHSTGDLRQRFSLLLFLVLATVIPSLFTMFPPFFLRDQDLDVAIALSFIGQLLTYIGLTYAVLKHDIFNFGFVINRVIIYSVISVLLLLAFGVIKYVLELFLHGVVKLELTGQQENSLYAVIAVSLYFSFHHLHGKAEHVLKRIFFQSWLENEKLLNKFINSSVYESPEKLLSSLANEFDRFSGGAGAAVYLGQPDECYTLKAQHGYEEAPPLVDIGDPLVVKLRDEKALLDAIQIQKISSVLRQSDLVLPIFYREDLEGFVVLKRRSKGSSYRPDEKMSLSKAIQQIRWELKVVTLETRLEHKENIIKQITGGRRKPL